MRDLYSSAVDSLTTNSIDGRHVQKRIGSIISIDAYAAKRVADELEALILEIDTRVLAGIQEWPNTKGFEVFPAPIAGGPTGRTRLTLQLLEKRYREVFRSLCDDVCGIMANSSGEGETIRIFHRRLQHWRSFLQRHGPDGLDEQARCGLFGELLVFRDLLLPNIGADVVVQAWRGCKKGNQDFQFLGRALEVKATRAAIPDRISVSNVQQLDGEGMEHMFLTIVHVHENETTGETLTQMVDSLRDVLPSGPRDLLDAGLEEIGYSDAHRDLYSRTRYQQIDLMHFQVREGFPRLTRNQIPDGLKSVRYDVSVDACRPFRADENMMMETLRKEKGDVDHR